MKKILSIVLIVALACSLAACSKTPATITTSSTPSVTVPATTLTATPTPSANTYSVFVPPVVVDTVPTLPEDNLLLSVCLEAVNRHFSAEGFQLVTSFLRENDTETGLWDIGDGYTLNLRYDRVLELREGNNLLGDLGFGNADNDNWNRNYLWRLGDASWLMTGLGLVRIRFGEEEVVLNEYIGEIIGSTTSSFILYNFSELTLWKFNTVTRELSVLAENVGQYEIRSSIRGTFIAYIDNDLKLIVINLESNEAIVVAEEVFLFYLWDGYLCYYLRGTTEQIDVGHVSTVFEQY